MALSSDAWRRWLGGISLAISAGMLLLGMTVLKGRLKPETFLIYWAVCMGVTGLALIIALVDLRAVRLRARREQEELMNRTLREIERERKERGADAPRERQP